MTKGITGKVIRRRKPPFRGGRPLGWAALDTVTEKKMFLAGGILRGIRNSTQIKVMGRGRKITSTMGAQQGGIAGTSLESEEGKEKGEGNHKNNLFGWGGRARR